MTSEYISDTPRLRGYDVRCLEPNSSSATDPRWLKEFCFRNDVWFPMSVDDAIWMQPEWLRTPDWFGPMLYCQDLEALRIALNECAPSSGPKYAIVAFSYIMQEDGAYPEWHHDGQPAFEKTQSKLLGYDVCDWNISAVSNCGLAAEEPTAYRWASRVNQFHLLNSVDDAREFERYANEAASEHAPFTVMGVHLIKAIGIEIPG